MNRPAPPPYYRIEVRQMRSTYETSPRPGHTALPHVVLPLVLILAGAVLTMNRLDIIHVARYFDLWPVLLIAAGLEELYLWASTGDDR